MFATLGAALEARFTDIEARLAAREQEEQAILVRLKRLDATLRAWRTRVKAEIRSRRRWMLSSSAR